MPSSELTPNSTTGAPRAPAGRRAGQRSFVAVAAFGVLFTLACADLASLPIAGGNFRLFYLAGLVGFALQVPRLRFDPAFAMRVAVLLLLLLPSIVVSVDRNRSLLYLVWVALTLVCTLGAVTRLVSFNAAGRAMLGPVRVDDAIVQAYRFQIVVGIALYAIGVHPRTQFLYYEPSYFSISLALYCAVVVQRLRERRPVAFDVMLMAAYLVTSASGAFILVLLVTALLNLPRARFIYLLAALVAAVGLGAAYVAFVDDANTALVRSLLGADADFYEILLRGGNRVGRLLAAWQVFNDHPVFGVGLGAFETVSQALNLDDPDTADYLSSDGKPAINIVLELLATVGIVGLVGFLVLLFPLLRWIFGKGFGSPLSRGVVCMLLLLMWESNYLRPYLWMALALCAAEMRHAVRTKVLQRTRTDRC